MSTTLTDQIFAALAEFSSTSRLYELKIGDREATGLLVEAFLADEAVQEVGTRDVIALSTDAYLELDALLGQPAVFEICLADGTRERFAGEICEAAMLGSDGGLARYRIRIASWLWRLEHARNSRVWQDKSVVEIIDGVFDAYLPLARWRWSDDVGPFLSEVSPRSYCCQYRESDLDFVRRLLAEEGLCWRIEQTGEGPGLVLFADSSQLCAVPEDASSEALGGVRFHGARSVEESDSIQALSAERRLHASLTTLLSYDYKAKQVVGASSPSHYAFGSKLPALESFDVPGQYAFADWQQAQHYADLRMQEQEARGQAWRGRSSVRTLRAGTRVQVLGAPLQQLGDLASFTVLRVLSIGVNNMPPATQDALAELFGPVPELLEELRRADMPEDIELAIAQARETGYANCFSAVATDIIWHPPLGSSNGIAYSKPAAFGAQSAIVVGADGNDQPSGADDLYCDRLGRVRIRFHWQDSGNATCWVRVAQRSAGGGMGQQFLPRIGQEVLVQFLENDIDRPIVVGALYNGQGEGGVVATPGGGRVSEADLSCFQGSHDHASSGQANICSGNGPLWHGASTDNAGHRNPASQWGIRSKEMGGTGCSQLLFDDMDGQGRIQLKSTFVGSELNLGQIIHTADNYRGGFRGIGIELRTDAYGVARAGAGLLLSSYELNHNSTKRDPCGQNSGVTFIKRAVATADAFSSAASTHESVQLAVHLGTTNANSSLTDPTAAPLKAGLNSLTGSGSSKSLQVALVDARAKNTNPGNDSIPQLSDPHIAVAVQASFGVNAGQSLQLANGEATVLVCGQDSQVTTGGKMRLQSRQAIGFLARATESSETGFQLVSARDVIDIQSQTDELKISAKNELSHISANAHVDLAAAKKISFSTSDGANITIDGGRIAVQRPGKIKVHAGKKSFADGAKKDYALPVLPVTTIEKEAVNYKLESTFALDQLTAYALSCTEGEFIAFLLPVFGYDIPPKTYLKLYERLRSHSVENAKIIVTNGGHYPAEYGNEKREIHVHKAAVDRAAKNNSEAWELLAALLHEFGHHVDIVLREDLNVNDDEIQKVSSDSEGEEGAKFAYAIAAFDLSGAANTIYAQLESPSYTGALRVNHADVRALIMESQSGEVQRRESKKGNVEYFSANREHERGDSHGHETIEEGLFEAGQIFRRRGVVKQIYFGNWLRDHSQLLDPKVVRAKSDPRDMSRYLSRNALTRIVSVLAKKKFGASEENKKIYAVTETRLKVYRALEHIDNPTNFGPTPRDPRQIDSDFEPLPTRAYVAIDPLTSMKRYIQASRDYMSRELLLAAEAGPTTEGFIHFGAGLHVLEDYFSHSNFVELSLRKLGFDKVLPWTSPVSTDRGKVLPVVTGMFASEDVIASLAGVIADLFFKVEWEYKAYKPGVPTEADEIALILLEEHSDQELTREQRKGRSTLLEKYKEMMILRDKWMSLPGQSVLARINHYTIGSFFNARNMFLNAIVQQVGANVDDAQVYAKGDPNTNGTTDPSHSQLAKDHDTHPFHTIAAELARIAVIQVGKSMAARWDGDVAANPGNTAASFLVHPNTISWQDNYVRIWAKANQNKVRRGESATEAEHWRKEAEAHHKEIIKKTEESHRASFDYISKHFGDLFGAKLGGK